MGSGPPVFIGDVALDEYFRPSTWPAAADKIELASLGTFAGGMIANAAAVFAALGDPARFVWTMRAGPVTDSLLAELRSLGVDTALVAFDETLADSRNIILLTGGDHIVMTPALGLTTIELSDTAFAALCEARFAYTAIGDLRALRHGRSGAAEVMDLAHAAGTPIVLDLDVGALVDGDEDLLSRVDVLLVNQVGFERLRGERTAAATVERLLDARTRVVVRTLGSDGVQLHTRAGEESVPGVLVEAVDVTGAGDTFGAAFAYALGRTNGVLEAATFANAAAARAVTAVGARSGMASRAEVAAFMGAHGLAVEMLEEARPLLAHVEPSTSERHAT